MPYKKRKFMSIWSSAESGVQNMEKFQCSEIYIYIYIYNLCSYELYSFQSSEFFVMHNTIFCDVVMKL